MFCDSGVNVLFDSVFVLFRGIFPLKSRVFWAGMQAVLNFFKSQYLCKNIINSLLLHSASSFQFLFFMYYEVHLWLATPVLLPCAFAPKLISSS